MRCSAYATGHHVLTGRSASSTAEASGSYALRRTRANSASSKASRLRCDWRWFVVRLHPGDGRGPRVLSGELSDRRVPLRLRPPCPALPLRAPGRAAPCQRGAGVSAPSADASPISPSPNAAIARTSGSGSASVAESGPIPSGSPTRPMARAARRRIRGSLSFTRTVRSGGGGGGGGGGGSLTFFPV